jgi:hypothetical protein
MESLRTGRFGAEDLVGKPPEIGGEKGWKYFRFHCFVLYQIFPT